SGQHSAKGVGRHRPPALGSEHETAADGLFSFQPPQIAQLLAGYWVSGVSPILDAVDGQQSLVEVNLLPFQVDEFPDAQPMAKAQHDHRLVAVAIAAAPVGGGSTARPPAEPCLSADSRLQSGYALPSSRIRRHLLILIDAPFSSCLPRSTG